MEESGTKNVPMPPSKLEIFVVENLEHIVHHCPHWNKEPMHVLETPACVRLHWLLPAPPPGAVPTHKPALVVG
eukprot:2414235-Amphidinium_carterae.3